MNYLRPTARKIKFKKKLNYISEGKWEENKIKIPPKKFFNSIFIFSIRFQEPFLLIFSLSTTINVS
jgi:hypothetical protein